MCRSLPKELKGPHRNNPAPENTSKVNPNYDTVSKEQSNKYHETTAKSLWEIQSIRLDLQLYAGFHCASVEFTDAEDFDKLK